MHAGRIVERGAADVVGTAPLHPYSRALISASPVPDPDEQRRNRALRQATQRSAAGVTASVGCSFAARCALATDVCRTETPALVSDRSEHAVACHHMEQLVPVRRGA
ncbi:MAG: oligopeptide/dipeptide ABC transporter ATP-binding protein [Jatrophihabitans sp.]|uniref:oligopeptide/dipeptide ABC transporter ATP-binding protein n=1 Tax=Jatrophihabitans sp. TaxID=1932789 RepID=UPI003F801724